MIFKDVYCFYLILFFQGFKIIRFGGLDWVFFSRRMLQFFLKCIIYINFIKDGREVDVGGC